MAEAQAERQSRSRARRRDEEVASATAWLLLAASRNTPGARVDAPELHAAAVAAIRRRNGQHDPRLGDGLAWRVPGMRTFYAVADAITGPRAKSGPTRYYRLDVFRRRRELLASRDLVGALRLQRDAFRVAH